MERNLFKKVFAWVVAILFIVSGTFVFLFVFKGEINPIYIQLYKDHFSAIVGLPAAAFISTFLILLLKITEKEALEFSVLQVTFKGTSGEIVLWIFIYMTIVSSIKILW
ncbi:hypothetical protein [Algoriphagus sp. Y33]|uniref:hypothetical protein n=1 Tax=Algoriphagus sp. Y33 TaxID=2772483 RepID=UPI00177C3B17|nr:hypothetical protein [Algoriphagus sp. Y33]